MLSGRGPKNNEIFCSCFSGRGGVQLSAQDSSLATVILKGLAVFSHKSGIIEISETDLPCKVVQVACASSFSSFYVIFTRFVLGCWEQCRRVLRKVQKHDLCLRVAITPIRNLFTSSHRKKCVFIALYEAAERTRKYHIFELHAHVR